MNVIELMNILASFEFYILYENLNPDEFLAFENMSYCKYLWN